MHFEQLQAILEVASTGSISAAAINLATNQPSLSRTIKALETELNVTFFERTPAGVYMTDAGEQLLPYITQVINDVHLLSKAAFRASAHTCPEIAEETPPVRICTSPIILDSLLSQALTELAAAFPQIEVYTNLIDNQNPNELSQLPDYDLFLGNNIASALDEPLLTLQNQRQMQLETLFTEHFQLVMHDKHPLASKKNLSFDDALDYPMILHDNGFSSNEFYKHYWQSSKEISVLFKSNNPRVITDTLRNTQALFLTTDYFSQNDYAHQTDLHIHPLKALEVEYFCLYAREHATLDQRLMQCAIREIISVLKFVHAKMKR